jgi:transcriptional regulator with XRE-family HTH domain
LEAIAVLGERIKTLRNEAGLTQEQLAESAKLDAKHIQDIEAGRTNPTLATLLVLAIALRLPLSDLVLGI